MKRLIFLLTVLVVLFINVLYTNAQNAPLRVKKHPSWMTVKVKKVTTLGERVELDLILTNISEQDKKEYISTIFRAFDDEGNQYNNGYYIRPDGGKVAYTGYSPGRTDLTFPAGLPVKMKVVILGLKDEAVCLKRLDWIYDQYNICIQFENIPLVREGDL